MPGPAKTLSPSAEKTVLTHIAAERPRSFKRDRVIVLLSWRAGLRACELVGLTWADVCDAEGQLTDEVRVRRLTTKGKTWTRYIPMHPELRVALEDHRPRRAPLRTPIVLNRSRAQLTANALAVWFRRLYSDAGIEGCSSHSGRRTFITNAARHCSNVGASIEDVRQLAGHALLSTTAAYIDPNNDAKRSLVASI